MKKHLYSLLSLAALAGCMPQGEEDAEVKVTDTSSYFIDLDRSASDTVCLYSDYHEKGAWACKRSPEGIITCNCIPATASGSVNTRVPGDYLISYTAVDPAGKVSPAVTRTVHVVENKAGFLSGTYSVACSCTAQGALASTVSAVNYTTFVNPAVADNCFELNALEIGSERILPSGRLSGSSIFTGYFSPDYARMEITGTLSVSKNTFTIESTAWRYSPRVNYQCRNVYNRLLVQKTAEAN